MFFSVPSFSYLASFSLPSQFFHSFAIFPPQPGKAKKSAGSKKSGKKSGRKSGKGKKSKSAGSKRKSAKSSAKSATSAKEPRPDPDILSEPAMTNLYYIAHDGPHALEIRGFANADGGGGKKGKKKGGGKKKKKK